MSETVCVDSDAARAAAALWCRANLPPPLAACQLVTILARLDEIK